MKTTENEFKMMTEQLRLTNSDESVGNYLRWIIKSDAAKEYWLETIKHELRKQLVSVVYENGYPIKAVPQATIESLDALIRASAQTGS